MHTKAQGLSKTVLKECVSCSHKAEIAENKTSILIPGLRRRAFEGTFLSGKLCENKCIRDSYANPGDVKETSE